MILTCPTCASRYFVDDASIGPEGRRVRCAGCGHCWREGPPAALAAESVAATASESGEAKAGDLKPRGVRADVSVRLREEAAEKRRTREAAAVGVVWAALGAGFCVLMLGTVVFRTDIVRLLPATAGAYAFVRMPVNPVGLSVENVQGKPVLEQGHEALAVTGVERNVETHPRDAAPVRIFVLDRSGRKLASQTAAPAAGGVLQPGETRAFGLSFLDPPLQAASVQVEFAFDVMAGPQAGKHAPTPVVTPSTRLNLRGMAPASVLPVAPARDAAPLPANSPYALPPAAAVSTSHG